MSAVRLGGGVAAAFLALTLAWLAAASFGPDRVVKPTVSMAPAPADSNDSANSLRAVITDRSRLLGDRIRAGSIAGVDISSQQPGIGHDFESSEGVADASGLVKSWEQRGEISGILREPSYVEGTSSLPYRNAALYQQPEGRDWRRTHNDFVRYGGGWLILGTSCALALFLLWRGRIRTAEGESGEKVKRFSSFERTNHWLTASGFIVLALTGLVITYGKPLLLPLLGSSGFGWLAQASTWIHMAAAAPFVIGILGMAVLWTRQNLPTYRDLEWLKQGGGFLHEGDPAPPAKRFNAGQKIVFWGVIVGGASAFLTGVALMFPFLYLDIAGMQWAQTLHAVIGLALIALIIGHIYIGTIGMEGAVDAMWSGDVDANWAKEHHTLWYDEIKETSASRSPGDGTSSAGALPAE